jgi:hypothetical protein
MSAKRAVLADDDPFSPAHFTWWVPAAGFEWQERGGDHRARYGRLTTGRAVLVAKRGKEYRTYYPLKVPELYRIFAETPQDPESMLAFANTYGFLGFSSSVAFLHTTSAAALRDQIRSAHPEEQTDWLNEIRSLRNEMLMFEALTQGSDTDLRHWVARWKERDGELARFSNRIDEKNDPRAEDEWLVIQRDDRGRPVDVHLFHPNWPDRRAVAWHHLVTHANLRIHEHCAPYLRQRGEEVGNLMIRVVPNGLLGAIWWQFARVITGELEYRRCRVCGRMIELSTGDTGFRRDREFCSNQCKFKDHRRKVKEAKAMKAAGKTVRQIAKHFETETDVIHNWLTKKK